MKRVILGVMLLVLSAGPAVGAAVSSTAIPPGPPIPGAMCEFYLQWIPFQREIYEQLLVSHGPEHPDTLEALSELQCMLTYVATFCVEEPARTEPVPDPMFD